MIVVRSQEKKDVLYELVPQEAIRQSAVFLLFVGDLNRAEKGARLHTDTFQPQGVEGLLISSVDAALAGQNALLAAESFGLWWCHYWLGALQVRRSGGAF